MVSSTEAAELLRFASTVAMEAGAFIRSRWDAPRLVERKSAIDLVTDCDRAAEELITSRIAKAFPGHALLAEESGRNSLVESDYCWLIDPLDGTTNWVHGCPHVAVSIAVSHKSRVCAGVVYDPMRNELFGAGSGLGARLNDQRIRPSEARSLGDALLATGFPPDCRERADFYLSFVAASMKLSRGLRRFGAAALDLCYVACGRFDAFWEWNLHAWDTAAGTVILNEAGGVISNFDGTPHDLFGDQTLASNGPLHAEMVALMQRTLHDWVQAPHQRDAGARQICR